MDALKLHWEKVVLAVVGLVALIVGGLRILDALSFADKFQLVDIPEKVGIPEFETDTLTKAQSLLVKKFQWANPVRGAAPKSIPLFQSIPIVEYQGQLIDMSDPNAAKLRPPVDNVWLIENNLDFLKSDVLEQDTDGDGYSNIDEWTDKTSPRDPAKHPPYWKKLYFEERKQKTYLIQFSTKLDDTKFQFSRLPSAAWPQRETMFLAMGETSKDGQFRFDKFEAKEAQVGIIRKDVSEATITYLPKNLTLVLVKQAPPTEVPTYFGQFSFELGQVSPDLVKEGEFFTLSKDSSTKYKVIDIQADSAEISFSGPQGEEKHRITKKQ